VCMCVLQSHSLTPSFYLPSGSRWLVHLSMLKQRSKVCVVKAQGTHPALSALMASSPQLLPPTHPHHHTNDTSHTTDFHDHHTILCNSSSHLMIAKSSKTLEACLHFFVPDQMNRACLDVLARAGSACLTHTFTMANRVDSTWPELTSRTLVTQQDVVLGIVVLRIKCRH
jgi:hypothetical protein